ncbi:Oidioi.mRNA.OKI2018_I69.chr2.g4176.t1.cds [Oikopleura dioica]|uniref:Oidioi.mRNA.OKI2018_I69.chr2.g4176.t1.cds n=1 Tax=Oikopleura dioica TaxID=34765 RepID=A0ABN7T347_OIKDI|nr:Oidioi.mRNA.OKI2018_I69.chr2.g4176.t1.cds [Oikopleura dioica]
MPEKLTFTIPRIDFQLLKNRDEETTKAFLAAITDVGFFFVKNHDVPKDLSDRLEHLSENFYNTTSEERNKVKEFDGKLKTEGSVFNEKPFLNSPLVDLQNDGSIELNGSEIDNVFHDYFDEICTLGLFLLEKCEEYKDVWYPVEEEIEGCLSVNIGKMMENLLDGKVKAVLHRVKPSPDHTRYCWPVFLGPDQNRRTTTVVRFLRFTHRGVYNQEDH